MSEPLKMTYDGVALHDLGTVSVLSQQGTYSPDEFPQKETRTLLVRIDARVNQLGYNFETLYAKIQSARAALSKQDGMLKWESPVASGAQPVLLNRPAIVVSHDIPEDPNGWGVIWQQINITFRYELDQTQDAALTATITGTGTTPVTVDLGHVTDWNDDWKNNFYSEWKNIKQRSPGTVSCSGELFAGLSEVMGESDTDTRVATLVTRVEALNTQLRSGGDVVLNYGDFIDDRTVRVESFNARIADAKTGKITWSATFSYTLFPDDESYCGAEFSSSLTTDKETGQENLTLSGRIIAATEALATAKLAVLVTQVQSVYGFTAANQTRTEIGKQKVNSNDTQERVNDDTDAVKSVFMELSFNYAWTKKAANIQSYTLSIADQDDLTSGLITRTYSGSVVASGATEDAAYAAALAKARSLGNDKHPFRVSANETRNDRQTVAQYQNGNVSEFLRLDFSYVYKVKGSRIYLEMTSSTAEEAFAESTERVAGFIVAATEASARSEYQTLVRASYAARIVRNESLDVRVERSPDGYGSRTGNNGETITSNSGNMFTRLEFSFTAVKAKDTGISNIKYAIRIKHDYVGAMTTSSIEGVYQADQVEFGKVGVNSALDSWLASLAATYGTLVDKSFDKDIEQIGTANPVLAVLAVRFSASFTKTLAGAAALLKAQLSEDNTYTATRWVFQSLPDEETGYDRAQNCGKTAGKRVVSGSVTGITEAACMDWINTQRTGFWNQFGNYGNETTPTDRYEEPINITKSFEFVPLNPAPAARGASPNFQVVTVNFRFTETIPNFRAPW